MGRLDAHQFRKAIIVNDVTGSQGTAGNQVIERSTDVDHHLTGGCFLKAIIGQLGHKHIHRAPSCQESREIVLQDCRSKLSELSAFESPTHTTCD